MVDEMVDFVKEKQRNYHLIYHLLIYHLISLTISQPLMAGIDDKPPNKKAIVSVREVKNIDTPIFVDH